MMNHIPKPHRSPTLIPANHQVVRSEANVVVGPAPRHPPSQSPQIKVNEINDVIRSIEIRCKCGEVIVVECQYDDQG